MVNSTINEEVYGRFLLRRAIVAYVYGSLKGWSATRIYQEQYRAIGMPPEKLLAGTNAKYLPTETNVDVPSSKPCGLLVKQKKAIEAIRMAERCKICGILCNDLRAGLCCTCNGISAEYYCSRCSITGATFVSYVEPY